MTISLPIDNQDTQQTLVDSNTTPPLIRSLPWAVLLSIGWFFTPKFSPWSNLYHETWTALVIACLLVFHFLRSKTQSFRLSNASLLTLLLVFIPGIQYAAGLILWPGDAWVQAAYLFGFFLAISVTQNLAPSEREKLITTLAFALLLAAVASAILQWFQLAGFQFDWLRQEKFITRPSANLSQPNHLGSLFCMGLLAVHFLFSKQYISRALLLLTSFLICVGLAFTGSRSAILGLTIISALHIYLQRDKRALPSDRHFLWVLAMLTVAYGLVWALWTHFPFGAMLEIKDGPALLRSNLTDRTGAWIMFSFRVLEAPWFGYGMGQIGMAHFLGETHLYPFGAWFQSAHNIGLDVLLWTGIPLGLFLIVMGARTILQSLSSFTPSTLLASGCMVIILNHAMLEFPLSFTYFLLYFGIFLGANNLRLLTWRAPAGWLLLALVIAMVATIKIAWDFRKTSGFLQSIDVEKTTTRTAGNLLQVNLGVNDHWAQLLRYSLADMKEPSVNLDLNAMERAARRLPFVHITLNYAAQLQRQGNSDLAAYWLKHSCNTRPREHCDYLKEQWMKLPQLNPSMLNATWPSTIFDNNR